MRNEQELLQALRQNIDGAVAITSTVRAARSLRQRYNREQQAAGRQGWQTPTILAWEPWLDTLWDAAILAGVESRVLLTSVQEAALWLRILARDEAAALTLSIEGLAEQAQRTWHAMQQYRIPLRDVRNDGSIDAQAFSRWAAEMEKICRHSSFVSSVQLEAALASTIGSGKIRLPEEIFLVGFDRTTPSQNVLIDALQMRGCDVQSIELEQTASAVFPTPSIVCALTQEEEILHAAYWIRHALLENPDQRIGVIISEQPEMRDRIDAIFRRILAPSSMDVHASGTKLPYEFSLGTPMHRMLPIHTALSLLQWLDMGIPAEEVSWLVAHGTFGSGSADARAALDRRFRERTYQMGGSVSFTSFREWISQIETMGNSSPLRQSLDRLAIAGKRHDLGKMRSFADWREIIEDLLAAAAWALTTPSDSLEYQLLSRWNVLLNELSSLNLVGAQESFSTVLKKLQHLAANTLFTLETKNAPVQILGAAESAGILFDSVWWMNTQASTWPQPGQAQPFLPWSMQRASHMPHADPAEDYAFALRVTRRIFASAGTVVVSFSLQESDPSTASTHIPIPEIAVSRVIRDVFPDVPSLPVEEFFSKRNSIGVEAAALVDAPASDASPIMETIDMEPAVPRQPRRVRGGVSFLKQQAACPFRAFAELRLGSEPLTRSEQGLSLAERGNMMHKVLQNFWEEVVSQETLLGFTDEECRQILRGHIRTVLQNFLNHTEESWQTALLQIEADRLEARLWEWLEVEKLRPPFSRLKTEASLDGVQLSGVELCCRIDRIDAVEQGIALMDYKTGPVDARACEGDRPDEPQLPAYAVLRQAALPVEEPLAGIAFAGLHAKKVGFTVVSSLPGIFSHLPPTRKHTYANMSPEEMKQQQETWQLTLTRLAEEFQLGAAAVDPKYGDKTCQYCAQALLCRVRETEQILSDNAEEEDSDFADADSLQGFDQ